MAEEVDEPRQRSTSGRRRRRRNAEDATHAASHEIRNLELGIVECASGSAPSAFQFLIPNCNCSTPLVPLAAHVRLLRMSGLIVDADEDLRENPGQQRLQAAQHQQRGQQEPSAALTDGRRAGHDRVGDERPGDRDAGRDQQQPDLPERLERPREVKPGEVRGT